MLHSPLHYKTVGDEKRPALLFLHGFLGEGSDWDAVSDAFAKTHFSILPDLPGHGKSRVAAADLDFSATATLLLEILDRHEISRAGVVGYSMGARLALWMVLANPDRFSHLVLEGCNPGIRSQQEKEERQKWEAEVLKDLKSRNLTDFMTSWYEMALFASLKKNPERLEQLKKGRIERQNRQGLIQSMKNLGLSRQDNLWPRLRHVQIPTLLICGALDPKFQRIAEGMAEQLVDVRLEVVVGAGHNVHFEMGKAYSTLLREFLP